MWMVQSSYSAHYMYLNTTKHIMITNYDHSWDVHLDPETQRLAANLIIPLSKGCPRHVGQSDRYDISNNFILDNKAAFHHFMLDNGFSTYLPKCYLVDYAGHRLKWDMPDQISTAIFKPADGRNGQGIKVIDINTRSDLSSYSECVITEYIFGNTEYIGTFFCLNGKIMCSKYVSGDFNAEPYIKTTSIRGCRDADFLKEQCDRCFGLIIEKLNYCGLICANFKIHSSLGLKIFEMNPRMGSTMIAHNELFNEFIRQIAHVCK